jgi:hypothetical protein
MFKTILLAVGGAMLCAVPGMALAVASQVASVFPGLSAVAAMAKTAIVNEGRKLLKKAAFSALSMAQDVVNSMHSKCVNAISDTVQEYCDQVHMRPRHAL